MRRMVAPRPPRRPGNIHAAGDAGSARFMHLADEKRRRRRGEKRTRRRLSRLPTQQQSRSHRSGTMMQLQQGQNTPIAASRVEALLRWNPAATPLSFDLSAFLLCADSKLPGDAGFVFYGQPRFEAAVELNVDARKLTVEFER
jgi:hypothetical protein